MLPSAMAVASQAERDVPSGKPGDQQTGRSASPASGFGRQTSANPMEA
jgi:hypothetical protein